MFNQLYLAAENWVLPVIRLDLDRFVSTGLFKLCPLCELPISLVLSTGPGNPVCA